MKPCPFCGSTDGDPVEVALDYNTEEWQWSWHFRCEGCGALGPECGMRTKAIEAWEERKGNASKS